MNAPLAIHGWSLEPPTDTKPVRAYVVFWHPTNDYIKNPIDDGWDIIFLGENNSFYHYIKYNGWLKFVAKGQTLEELKPKYPPTELQQAYQTIIRLRKERDALLADRLA